MSIRNDRHWISDLIENRWSQVNSSERKGEISFSRERETGRKKDGPVYVIASCVNTIVSRISSRRLFTYKLRNVDCLFHQVRGRGIAWQGDFKRHCKKIARKKGKEGGEEGERERESSRSLSRCRRVAVKLLSIITAISEHTTCGPLIFQRLKAHSHVILRRDVQCHDTNHCVKTALRNGVLRDGISQSRRAHCDVNFRFALDEWWSYND